MVDIQRVKVRAKINFGSLSVETPYILSFSVRKSRGQISTFDATLKIDDSTGNLVGDEIEIYAGEGSPSKKIFTGIIKRAQLSPCFDDPKYSFLSLSGEDVLSMLRQRKYSRRVKATKACWASINSVTRPGHKSGKFKYVKEELLFTTDDDVKKSLSLIKSSGPSAAWPILDDSTRMDKSDIELKIPFKITYQSSTGE
jgi:hypothetical protein